MEISETHKRVQMELEESVRKPNRQYKSTLSFSFAVFLFNSPAVPLTLAPAVAPGTQYTYTTRKNHISLKIACFLFCPSMEEVLGEQVLKDLL